MKKFIVKGLIVLAGVLFVDIVVGLLGKTIIVKLAHDNHSGQTALLGYNLQTATADIVVIGGSTASCHFIPSILSDSLSLFVGRELTAFNAGAYYQQPSYSYCVLKSLIERKKPSYVIVDIQPQQLGGKTVVAALKPLRPYYTINKNIKEILDENESWSDRILLNLNMFRFNTEIIKLVASFKNPVGADGFAPKEGIVNRYDIVKERDYNSVNSVVASEFERLLEIANDNEIDLFVVMSPRLEYADKESASYQRIIELCRVYNVPLFDFTSDIDLCKGELFCDQLHLNPNGAKVLTLKTCAEIKKNLNNK